MDIFKGKEYWNKVTSSQKDIMQRMKAVRVLEVHSDGDVTFENPYQKYVLTTEGELFAKDVVYDPYRRAPQVDRYTQGGTIDPALDDYRVPRSSR